MCDTKDAERHILKAVHFFHKYEDRTSRLAYVKDDPRIFESYQGFYKSRTTTTQNKIAKVITSDHDFFPSSQRSWISSEDSAANTEHLY